MTEHAPRTRSHARTTAVAVGVLVSGLALSACSGPSHSAYQGGVVPAGDPRPGVSVSASPGATGAAGTGASASPSAKPYIEAVARKGCAPQSFTASAGLVGGAIHGWITPLASSPGSSSARTDAVAAADFAARQLRSGARAVAGCPTALALAKVSEQNAVALTSLSKSLSGGTVDPARVRAVDALYADVLAQATRLRLRVVEKKPARAQLAG